MMSFGFEGGDYLCFSIETRKTKGQAYSAIKGLFRQFELISVVADERDLVRLRTNYRKGEEVYLYRLRGTPEQARKFLLDYLRRLNRLRQRPEWYNAVTDNCTTGIRVQRAAADRAPWDWRLLANGYGNEVLYERGMIATNLPLAELKQRCHINERARAAGQAALELRRGQTLDRLHEIGAPDGVNAGNGAGPGGRVRGRAGRPCDRGSEDRSAERPGQGRYAALICPQVPRSIGTGGRHGLGSHGIPG